MRNRLEAFERRLAALAAILRGWSAVPEREKRTREYRETLAAILRAGLEHAGIDPNEAAMLRHLEDPDWPPAFLRPRKFIHPLRRLAERQKPRSLLDALYEQSKRYHKGPPPNLRSASTMQLIGYYCFGDGADGAAAREAPA